jgi:cell division protein FtsL
MSTIIIGVFSLVILKRQTKIIERQTEISDIQNKITQNQLEIESKCELIVTNKDENIHCANS